MRPGRLMPSRSRLQGWTLGVLFRSGDIAAIAVLNELTHLPVILDPSHATGKRSLVPALSRAGVAIGADGLIVEVHPCPELAVSDGAGPVRYLADGAVRLPVTTRSRPRWASATRSAKPTAPSRLASP